MTNYSKGAGEKAKLKRQKVLLSLIQEESVGTQTELVERLTAAGVPCTQVSISRDIRELGLIKRDGRYTEPDAGMLPATVSGLSGNISAFIRTVTVVGDNLVVIKTLPGTAHSVGLLVDHVHWPKVAGTVAGDDTVFLAILGGAAECEETATRLNQLIQKGK